ncbi:somatostatin receptor type 2-like [Branchiostoma lanceolatum]|uniref:somatostatin receptor type 2-like n=1 Tax=Branchiostoma lanceolatum TaxID=7740 RepID=UPI0034523CA8
MAEGVNMTFLNMSLSWNDSFTWVNDSMVVGEGFREHLGVGTLVLSAFYMVLIVLGLVGNVVVIFVILKVSGKKKAMKMADVLVMNLAVSDILLLSILPFMIIDMIVGEWTFSQNVCKFVVGAVNAGAFASFLSLAALSVDRYHAMAHPLKSLRVEDHKKTATILFLLWSLAICTCIPYIWYARVLVYGEGTSHCVLELPATAEDPNLWHRVSVAYSFIVGFVVPLVIIITCYSLILGSISKSHVLSTPDRVVGLVAGRQHNYGHAARVQKHKKLTRVVLILVAAFVFCWLPYHVFHIVRLIVLPEVSKTWMLLALAFNALSFTNSVINPILYSFLGEQFRQSFRQVLGASTATTPTVTTSFQPSRAPQT